MGPQRPGKLRASSSWSGPRLRVIPSRLVDMQELPSRSSSARLPVGSRAPVRVVRRSRVPWLPVGGLGDVHPVFAILFFHDIHKCPEKASFRFDPDSTPG
jgi:hypothetical protein